MDELNQNQSSLTDETNEKSAVSFGAIDPGYLLVALRKKIFLIAILAIIAAVMTYMVAGFTLKKTWKGRCVIIKHPKNLALGTDVPYLYQEVDFNTILETVRLRENLEEVIKRLNLKTSPSSLYGNIQVTRGNRSNILMVTAIGSTPKEAADIANAMGDAFINSYNRIMNYSSDKVFQYYQSQRDSMTREISKAEDEFSAFRAKEGIVSYEQELGLKLEKLSQIELGLEESYMTQKENQTKIADIKERLASMPDQVKVTETYRKQEAALKRDLQLKLDELRQKYTEENPKVIEIREQLNTIEKGQKERGSRGVVDEETYGENFIKANLPNQPVHFGK